MIGMMLALAPVVAAAVGGFVLLNQGVIASFQDIIDRQRSEIVPAQRIGLLLWDATIAVDEFVEDGNIARQAQFRSQQTAIEAELAGLRESVAADPVASALATGAQQDLKMANDIGGDLISVLRKPADPSSADAMERFDGAMRAASDKLEGLVERLEDDIDEDGANAERAYERALWLAGIAAGVCLLTIIGGVVLIGRVMSASVDRLVDGALRFAEGDRQHRIDVRIPPELRRVASEFNRMIIRIHTYEEILADRALKDALTRLPNRRAFEDAIARDWDRVQRLSDPFALLMIDVDHFKQINDTHGHAKGDEVLRRIADTLAQQLRAAEKAFRTGGEEFAVILPGSNIAEARAVAERLRVAVASNGVSLSGGEVSVTISIGLTDSQGVDGPDEMLRRADEALYRAKSRGRNRVVTSREQFERDVHAA